MNQPNLPGFDEEMARITALEQQSSITETQRQQHLARMFAKFKHYEAKMKDKRQAALNHQRAMRCIKLMERE